jgi:hypothetical protein
LPSLDPSKLDGIEKPELVFGVVAAVGTPIDPVCLILEEALTARGYKPERLHLSSFMNGLSLEKPMPPLEATVFDRINMQMDRGNELRQKTGRPESLALLAAAHINAKYNAANWRGMFVRRTEVSGRLNRASRSAEVRTWAPALLTRLSVAVPRLHRPRSRPLAFPPSRRPPASRSEGITRL